METLIIFISLVAFVLAIDPNVTIIDEAPKMRLGVGGRKEMIATKDKDVFMTCVVQNKPAAKKVEWRGIAPDNTNIMISEDQDSKDAFRYQIDQPSAISWRVKIQNIQIAQEMRYMCQVEIGQQKYATEERYIRVTENPQIMDLKTSSNQMVDEGDPVTLTCNCTGWPLPIVKWSSVAGGLLPTGGQEHLGYTLNLGKSKANYRGFYKCQCENMVGKAERIVYLGIIFKPIITVNEMEPAQAYGYRKDLLCTIDAYPQPTDEQITWTHNGVPVDPKRSKINYIEGAMNRVTTKLTLYSVNQNDMGLYTCEARNSKGPTQANINLKFSSRPTPDITGEIRSGGSVLSLSITTIFMFVTVVLLHTCKY